MDVEHPGSDAEPWLLTVLHAPWLAFQLTRPSATRRFSPCFLSCVKALHGHDALSL